MGLIYIPGDANQVETQLTNDLQMSEDFLNRLKEATTHLTTIVGGGKLDGKAYKRGLGLMQDCVLPTIQHTTSAIDGIKQDLSSFSRAKSGMPNEPLYEDKLSAHIAELEAQKAAQAALSAVYQSHILSLIAGPVGAAVDQAIHQFTDAKNQLSSWGNSVEEEIRKTKEKLSKLRQFNSQTNHLFHDSVSNLKVAMQGVMVLNGSKINSDGSYSLPAGTNRAWFNKFKAKDYRGVSVGDSGKNSKEQGYKLFASGALWVDKNGQLRTNGSAEASAYLANLKTKGKFEIAGIKFNGEGHAFVGVQAAADIKASLGEKGLAISAEAEALLGTKAGASGGFTVGKGILSLEGDTKAEAMAGLWGKASGEFDVGKYGITAYGDAEAKAGAEAKASEKIQAGNGPLKIGEEVKGDAFAGAKASASGEAAIDTSRGNFGLEGKAGGFAGAEASAEGSLTTGYNTSSGKIGVKAGVGASAGGGFAIKDGHVKADIDLGVALGVGFEVKASADFDAGSMISDANKVISWINPFD
ncbi:hypothetical protein [Lactococcus lactis]|uniref:hypothetical protein n=1 Tax=Lactococcus lactis TaxID=1358 RepID=UPI00111DF0A2|nr:hypothetical protein [Lactococcus lactis]TNU79988.1 hypothetical protein FIB48_05530 [Lactococcus lactis subsp. lactis]